MTAPEIPDQKITFTASDVEAGVRSLIDNQYGVETNTLDTPGELERADLEEIVQLVLTYATKGVRESAYRAGRRDALRWAADRIDPGPREADVAIDADRAMTFVIDADRGTATKLRLWADQQGEDQDTPEDLDEH